MPEVVQGVAPKGKTIVFTKATSAYLAETPARHPLAEF